MNHLELLKRTDLYTLTDNKMTSYCSTLGGGSIKYWDGKMASFLSVDILTDLTAFVQVIDPKTGQNLVQQMYHWWYPHKIVNRFMTHQTVYIFEEKTIANDTFVSRMEFQSETYPTDLILRISGAVREGCVATARGNALVIRDVCPGMPHRPLPKHRHSTVYKVVGFSRPARIRCRGRQFTIDMPLHLDAVWEHVHAPVQRVDLVVAASETEAEAWRKFRSALRRPAALFAKKQREWETFFQKNVPPFACDNPQMLKMYYYIFFMMKSNVFDFGTGNFREPFVSTGKFRLQPQWFWDSAFGEIIEKWMNGLPGPKSSMRCTLGGQRADGILPFTLYSDGAQYDVRDIIQPWIFPMAVWDYYLKSGDRGILREALPVLIKFDEWMMANRDENHEQLVNLHQPGESGWDNCKRYVLHRHLKQVKSPMLRQKRRVQSPDFNTYLYLGRRLIARMARELKKTAVEREFTGKARQTAAGIRSMWSEKTGLFMDRFEKGHEMIPIRTPGGVIPLLGALADKRQKQRVVKNLTDPKILWTKYPVATLDQQDPDFNIRDEYYSYWNGRVWPPTNWLVVESLCRAGCFDVAAELTDKSLRMCSATGEPWCMENYHPHTGVPYFTHNCSDYIWGGLFNDLLLRRVLGIQGNAPRNEVIINPLFSADTNTLSVRDVVIGQHRVDVQLEKQGRHWQLRFTHRGRKPITLITSAGRRKVKNLTVTQRVRTFNAPHWLEL